ncbi:hypothetical protein SAZ_06265 [Streptomyces noursei ZPM]|uniref:AraC family transcriptional regulator n=1 Tax=Streptomyces noursei TaxID=1971 RepID=A0A059W1B5_STRNR|nr:AraC family transcriptional regulator [Streptomyces noursei]AKA08522.1 hypothetical protein SAZ_06265 [Streptomyces noursei ZPM]EXU92909.1 hypothetical protein P354_01000 [Streptomyces noursei PD-1]GCB89284.1 AraC family transcriptional regulator [Streptomyces noursei]
MISALNRLVDLVEEHLAEEFDVHAWAGELGTTEYHLRRMTVAAADVVRGEDGPLSIAVRHGYGSTEAFGRAFRAVHGVGCSPSPRVPLPVSAVGPTPRRPARTWRWVASVPGRGS